MDHLATVLQLLASKAGAATAAAVLAVGSVTIVQQAVPVELDATAATAETGDQQEPVEGELEDGEELDGGEGEDTDAGEGTDDGEETTDDGEETTDGGAEGPEGTGDDGDGDREAAGRGSATSERVHAAQVGDADVRPGDPGFGAAVSASARSGGHGQRVSAAARGERAEATPADDDEKSVEPATAPERGGQGKGHGKGKQENRG